MSVSTTTEYSGPYDANGVTTVFPFTFKAMGANEVRVFYRGAAGVDTPVSSGYSVSLVSGGGGSVTFTTAPADAVGQVYIVSDPIFAQSVQYENGAPWLADTVNLVNDRAAVRDISLRGRVSRALAVSIGTPTPPLVGDLSGANGKVLAVVDQMIVAIENDPASAADSAAQALIARDDAITQVGLATEQTALASGFSVAADASATSAAQSASLVSESTASGPPWPNSASTVVPRGVTNMLKTAGGSTGTNGTGFVGTFTGGGGADARFKFDVVAGALDRIYDIEGGYGYTSAPTPVLTASAGLTGATITVTIGSLVPSGANYWVVSTDNATLQLFKNVSGTATAVSPAVYRPYQQVLDCTPGGTANAVTLVPKTGFTVSGLGQRFEWTAAGQNNGNMMLSVPGINGGVAAALLLPNGDQVPPVTVRTGYLASARWRVASSNWELVEPANNPFASSIVANQTAGTGNAITCTVAAGGEKFRADFSDVIFATRMTAAKNTGSVNITLISAGGVTLLSGNPLYELDGVTVPPEGAWLAGDTLYWRRLPTGVIIRVSPPDNITSALAGLVGSVQTDMPPALSPVMLRHLDKRRWEVQIGGVAADVADDFNRGDRTVFDVYDMGNAQSQGVLKNNSALCVNSMWALIDGVRYDYANVASNEVGSGVFDGIQPSTNEFAIPIGTTAGPVPTDFYGFGHGLVKLVPGSQTISMEVQSPFTGLWSTTTGLFSSVLIGGAIRGRKMILSGLYDVYREPVATPTKQGQVLITHEFNKDGCFVTHVHKIGRALGYNTGTLTPAEGATITGATSGATAIVVVVPDTDTTGSNGTSDRAGTMFVKSATGTFVNGENLQVAGVTQCKATGAVGVQVSMQNAYFTMGATTTVNRAKVPNFGEIRIGYEDGTQHPVGLYYSAGSTEIVEGATIVGGTSGASAFVTTVPTIGATGSWAGGTRAGLLYLKDKVGSFTNGEELRVGGTRYATCGLALAGTWPGQSRIAFYRANKPNILLEAILYKNITTVWTEAACPLDPPGDFSECTTSQFWVQDRAEGVRKFYCNGRSGTSVMAWEGTFTARQQYRFRKGTAI